MYNSESVREKNSESRWPIGRRLFYCSRFVDRGPRFFQENKKPAGRRTPGNCLAVNLKNHISFRRAKFGHALKAQNFFLTSTNTQKFFVDNFIVC
nr:MAG TPA: hypothetical protein [Caudoviricetes sp.]